MTKEETFNNLCSYDERNPDYETEYDSDREPRKDCFCDNCFNGRDELAVEILRLIGDIE